jgi:hypothetical protein
MDTQIAVTPAVPRPFAHLLAAAYPHLSAPRNMRDLFYFHIQPKVKPQAERADRRNRSRGRPPLFFSDLSDHTP